MKFRGGECSRAGPELSTLRLLALGLWARDHRHRAQRTTTPNQEPQEIQPWPMLKLGVVEMPGTGRRLGLLAGFSHLQGGQPAPSGVHEAAQVRVQQGILAPSSSKGLTRSERHLSIRISLEVGQEGRRYWELNQGNSTPNYLIY